MEQQLAPSPDSLTNLPLWQRLLLARVQQGIPWDKARLMQGSSVSPTLLMQARQANPAFDAALLKAQVGALSDSPLTEREHARALLHTVVDDAYAESRGLDPETGERALEPVFNQRGEHTGDRAAIRPQDRVANRRLLLETGGAVGQGAQASARVDVRISIAPHLDGAPPLRTYDATATTAPEEAPDDDETPTVAPPPPRTP